MSDSTHIMDTIITTDKVFVGVVDYVDTKHICFYDLSVDSSAEVIQMIIAWRMFYQHMQFGVFLKTFVPNISNIPTPILINKKVIKESSFRKTETSKRKVRRASPRDTDIV